ncbi:MAG: rhodanese-like domain-containing protein [Gammaproteobacteria bacterium]|nr:rhodanese-like domain-containing protein [Gammaproteobacteria bacterium]
MEQLLEFISNHPLLVTAAVVTGSLLLFNELRMAGSARFAVSPDQAVRLMNKGALVLDLRDEQAYSAGHLNNAKRLDPGKLEDELKRFDRFRGKPVVAYDDRGTTAGRAVARLRQHDFEQAFMLRGGVHAWREEQLPLVRGQDKIKDKKAGKGKKGRK